METVQQHEWGKPRGTPYWLRICKKCGTRRILQDKGAGFIYKVYGELPCLQEEPPCITRNPDKEAGNDDTYMEFEAEVNNNGNKKAPVIPGL